MIKVRARIREHVEQKRLDVKVDGFVVNEELAEEREILGVELYLDVSG